MLPLPAIRTLITVLWSASQVRQMSAATLHGGIQKTTHGTPLLLKLRGGTSSEFFRVPEYVKQLATRQRQTQQSPNKPTTPTPHRPQQLNILTLIQELRPEITDQLREVVRMLQPQQPQPLQGPPPPPQEQGPLPYFVPDPKSDVERKRVGEGGDVGGRGII